MASDSTTTTTAADLDMGSVDDSDLEAYLAQGGEDFGAFDDGGAVDDDERPADADGTGVERDAGTDVMAESESRAREATQRAGDDEPPPWVQKLLDDSNKRAAAAESQVERLAQTVQKLLEVQSAAKAEPPKPQTPADMLREALSLDDDDPDKQALLKAAATAALRDDFPDEDSRARADQAKRFAERGLAKRAKRAKERATHDDEFALLRAWKREREVETEWKRLSGGLPALAQSEDARAGFPHVYRLFTDPAVLRDFVVSRGESSTDPAPDVLRQAISDLEDELAEVGTDPAEARVAARLARRRDPALASALEAYAKLLDSAQETQGDKADEQPRARKKPSVPRAPSGGKPRGGGDDLESWMSLDRDEWTATALINSKIRGQA